MSEDYEFGELPEKDKKKAENRKLSQLNLLKKKLETLPLKEKQEYKRERVLLKDIESYYDDEND